MATGTAMDDPNPDLTSLDDCIARLRGVGTSDEAVEALRFLCSREFLGKGRQQPWIESGGIGHLVGSLRGLVALGRQAVPVRYHVLRYLSGRVPKSERARDDLEGSDDGLYAFAQIVSDPEAAYSGYLAVVMLASIIDHPRPVRRTSEPPHARVWRGFRMAAEAEPTTLPFERWMACLSKFVADLCDLSDNAEDDPRFHCLCALIYYHLYLVYCLFTKAADDHHCISVLMRLDGAGLSDLLTDMQRERRLTIMRQWIVDAVKELKRRAQYALVRTPLDDKFNDFVNNTALRLDGDRSLKPIVKKPRDRPHSPRRPKYDPDSDANRGPTLKEILLAPAGRRAARTVSEPAQAAPPVGPSPSSSKSASAKSVPVAATAQASTSSVQVSKAKLSATVSTPDEGRFGDEKIANDCRALVKHARHVQRLESQRRWGSLKNRTKIWVHEVARLFPADGLCWIALSVKMVHGPREIQSAIVDIKLHAPPPAPTLGRYNKLLEILFRPAGPSSKGFQVLDVHPAEGQLVYTGHQGRATGETQGNASVNVGFGHVGGTVGVESKKGYDVPASAYRYSVGKGSAEVRVRANPGNAPSSVEPVFEVDFLFRRPPGDFAYTLKVSVDDGAILLSDLMGEETVLCPDGERCLDVNGAG